MTGRIPTMECSSSWRGFRCSDTSLLCGERAKALNRRGSQREPPEYAKKSKTVSRSLRPQRVFSATSAVRGFGWAEEQVGARSAVKEFSLRNSHRVFCWYFGVSPL